MSGIRVASVMWLVVGISILSKGQGNAAIQACTDGQCEAACSPTTYPLGPADNKAPNFLRNFTLLGAESKSGAGYDVFFNIPQPVVNCRTQITTPFAEEYNTTGTGNIVVDASQAGCYYAHISSGKGFYPQSCCDDTCSLIDAQSFVKRENDDWQWHPRPSSKSTTKAPSATVAAPTNLPASVTCNAPWTTTGSLYQKAGNQTVVSDVQDCSEEDDCQISTSRSISVSSQLSSESSTSLTNSVGASIAITAGVNFIATAQVTAGLNYEFADTATKSTGITNGTDNSVVTSYLFNQLPGTSLRIWFTPILLCSIVNSTCGGNATHLTPLTMEKCEPSLLPNGTVDGNFGIMAVG